MTNSSSSANGKDSRIHHIVTATPVSEVGVGYQINAQPNTRYLWATSVSAPVYALETSINSSNRVRFLGNAFVRLTPIEDLPGDLHPIIQVIDNFERNNRLGLLFEARVGKGRLMVSSIALDVNRPEVQSLRHGIFRYIASGDFQPSSEIGTTELRSFLHVQNYDPEDRAFGCINGQNRYTRALYGSHTMW